MTLFEVMIYNKVALIASYNCSFSSIRYLHVSKQTPRRNKKKGIIHLFKKAAVNFTPLGSFDCRLQDIAQTVLGFR